MRRKTMNKKTSALQTDLADTVISRDLQIKGNLQSDNDIWIDGEVHGAVTTKGNISVGDTGKIFGNIEASEVRIAGAVEGDIKSHETLTCESSAKVSGDIYATGLSVENGAFIEGRIEMSRPEAYEEE